ncbi:SDR family NAD(P)-dependent oxidoreductase [Sphingosinicella sp. LY1275]|uniref:SDR family NAD(P)-dependent oxidoreductase n=1 Tax=Sphingosinicella sp. LY1275 TaxID=3095379 RepID=UPI002ADEDC25|nr:SDR family NAD(P)-dependent oxidoreductase [Sphingosinicella sp. LY1275]MEA1015354.1 SDR family NAD(P)-dependent oxidoreductase [Sphingosinicella sp. LY1275]
MSDVHGRVAIVTGAGQGLGRSYALALAAAGAKIVVNDIGAVDGVSTAENVTAEIRADGGEAIANRDTVAAAEGGLAIVQAALDAFGRIDILVSNAGIERNQSYAKSSQAQWSDVIDVHLNGTHHLCHAAWPHLIAQKHGRLILVTSPSGLWGNFSQASYAAAKMGIIGLANVLAIEGKAKNVLVNCLAPIATTPMSAHLLSPELAARLRPELVSPAVLQLASDKLETTGAILVAGGGWFSSAHVALSPGVHVREGETLDAHWGEIVSGDTARPGAPLDPETLEKMFVGHDPALQPTT